MLALLLPLLLTAAPVPPEVQAAAATLRPGERARFEQAHGPLAACPLYRGQLTFDPSTRKVSGTVLITFVNQEIPRDDVLLRVTPNATHPEAVVLRTVLVNDRRAEWSWADPSLARVQVRPAAVAGEVVTISVALEAEVPRLKESSGASLDDLNGRGGDYGAFSSTASITSLAGIIPMLPPEKPDGAPFEGPSGIGDLGTFEPSTFFVSLTVPTGHRVVAPGQVLGEVPDGKGGAQFLVTQALAREFPLLVTRGYEVTTTKVGDVTVESHFLKADAESGKAVQTAAALALRDLDGKLGPYPWTSLKVVEARFSGGAGGMEFPGLVTASASLYGAAVDPGSALGGGQQAQALGALLGPGLQSMFAGTLEFTIHHELAHQWLGMVVGSDPIEHPATDEPLAQHLALLLTEWRHGRRAADELRDLQLKGTYRLFRAMGGRDGAADRPTSEFVSNAEYAALVYGKAPGLYDEARKLLGDEAWLKALKSHASRGRWSWVATDGVIAAAAEVAPGKAKALRALQRRWFEEAHGDKDLGTLDEALSKVLGAGGGMPAGVLQGVDRAQLEALMKEYEEAMRALMGP